MWPPSIWIWDLAHNFSTVVHGQKKGLIVHAIRKLVNTLAVVSTGGFSSYPCELLNIKFNISLGQFPSFITKKATTGEAEEVLDIVPVCGTEVIDSFPIKMVTDTNLIFFALRQS